MKKTITLLAAAVGIVVGAIAGRAVVQSIFGRLDTVTFDETLVDISKAMNATLPMQVDRVTRLDSTMAGPGNRLTYLYTLVNVPAGELDSAQFVQAITPQLVNGYKSNPDMATLRNMDVELHYQYRDLDGAIVATIVVSPKDF